MEMKPIRKSRRLDTNPVPYNNPLLREAVKYLVQEEGVREIKFLNHKYVRVQLIRVLEQPAPEQPD